MTSDRDIKSIIYDFLLDIPIPENQFVSDKYEEIQRLQNLTNLLTVLIYKEKVASKRADEILFHMQIGNPIASMDMLFKYCDRDSVKDCFHYVKEGLKIGPAEYMVKDIYPVCSRPFRGNVLIINNSFGEDDEAIANDERNTKVRRGSNFDVKELQKVLRDDFKYQVQVRNDMERDDMVLEVNKFVSDESHKFCDAAGIVLMSHGSGRYLEDNKERLIHINTLLEPIRSAQSQIGNKPVFVIIQACRNSIEQCAADKMSVPLADEFYKIDLSNTFILYPTMPNIKSFRDPEKGTYFIQNFVKVLKKHGRERSIHEISILVAGKEGKVLLKESRPDTVAKLVPQYHSFLTKEFYFDTTVME